MARQRTPEGPPPPPAVQKIRLRYAKRGRLRFSSTRDFQRALERALRRAGVPMAYSAGFHPHPKISYANAAPTGTASEAEYFEISVTEPVEPSRVAAALDEALPDGIDVLEAADALPGSLADRLQASEWIVELRGLDADQRAQVERTVSAFLAAETVEISRMTKSGNRTFDVRSAVLALDLQGAAGRAAASGVTVSTDAQLLRVLLRHTTPTVRPDDVITALAATGEGLPQATPLMTRLVQGPWSEADATVGDPLR
ncbi:MULTISPECIES: TIGR03936 family radical SAM-associated protein [Arsenicicoccus]|uniref:TIGR03936 family radical SAM-associated protein n=1 Tax=Arsenicicoccus bolidensis TaxID=229480 RepID=A0ABS9PZN6_9MICO|nr:MULTISPECIES: TIGR03936 family radical SAM-associated protein [Arsenicicoccus]MCG7321090.1 TIGR03936 family radical SAM-associated protein [Arsenicicoccus bolidensis]